MGKDFEKNRENTNSAINHALKILLSIIGVSTHLFSQKQLWQYIFKRKVNTFKFSSSYLYSY